ncbi:hypothetical protein D3C72_1406810 [compost metagenome]
MIDRFDRRSGVSFLIAGLNLCAIVKRRQSNGGQYLFIFVNNKFSVMEIDYNVTDLLAFRVKEQIIYLAEQLTGLILYFPAPDIRFAVDNFVIASTEFN